jgi:hypothetical protein
MTLTYSPMGRFSFSTASLVLLYKGTPTCLVAASRVSCLYSNPFHFSSTSCRGDSDLFFLASIVLDFMQQLLQSKDSLHRR